jgi:hypothetical protein
MGEPPRYCVQSATAPNAQPNAAPTSNHPEVPDNPSCRGRGRGRRRTQIAWHHIEASVLVQKASPSASLRIGAKSAVRSGAALHTGEPLGVACSWRPRGAAGRCARSLSGPKKPWASTSISPTKRSGRSRAPFVHRQPQQRIPNHASCSCPTLRRSYSHLRSIANVGFAHVGG